MAVVGAELASEAAGLVTRVVVARQKKAAAAAVMLGYYCRGKPAVAEAAVVPLEPSWDLMLLGLQLVLRDWPLLPRLTRAQSWVVQLAVAEFHVRELEAALERQKGEEVVEQAAHSVELEEQLLLMMVYETPEAEVAFCLLEEVAPSSWMRMRMAVGHH